MTCKGIWQSGNINVSHRAKLHEKKLK